MQDPPRTIEAARVVQEDITPQRAADLLDSAIPSRLADVRVVSGLEEEIRAGTLSEGDARIFISGADGRLISGRRVLHAVVSTGITVTMTVGITDGQE
jgi:hypothetical protein